jgi:hypothetical protein
MLLLFAGMALGWELAAVPGLAVGSAVGALAAGGTMWAAAGPLLPAGTLRRALVGLIVTVALLGLLLLARRVPVVWIVCITLLGLGVLKGLRRHRPVDGAPPGAGAVAMAGTPLGEGGH